MLFTGLVYVLVFGAFVWLGLRESAVLGFTGLSRVVLNVSNAAVIVLPLVALVRTAQSVVGSRSSGFFELFLSQPCRRADWLIAVLASRVLVIVGPLVLLLSGALVAGAFLDEAALLPLVTRSLLVTIALTWAFVGLGLWLSSVARTAERATVYVLLAWLVATALHDFRIIALLFALQVAARRRFRALRVQSRGGGAARDPHRHRSRAVGARPGRFLAGNHPRPETHVSGRHRLATALGACWLLALRFAA